MSENILLDQNAEIVSVFLPENGNELFIPFSFK